MRHMIFGESHGPAIGVVLEGVPAGLELDLEQVKEPVGFYDDVELVPVVGGASERGLHVEAMGAGDTLVVAVAIITVYLKDG